MQRKVRLVMRANLPSMEEGAATATAANREKRAMVKFIVLVIGLKLFSSRPATGNVSILLKERGVGSGKNPSMRK
jgi:hypothetical protein